MRGAADLFQHIVQQRDFRLLLELQRLAAATGLAFLGQITFELFKVQRAARRKGAPQHILRWGREAAAW